MSYGDSTGEEQKKTMTLAYTIQEFGMGWDGTGVLWARLID